MNLYLQSAYQIAETYKFLLYFLPVLFLFIYEIIIYGWNKSSLKNISNIKNNSSKVDLFYYFLKLISFPEFLFNLIFFGYGFYLLTLITKYAFFEIESYFFQFFLALTVTTFINYWYHRIFHSTNLWELHKIHHAAREMTILTATREHPLVKTGNFAISSAILVLIGISPVIVFITYGILGCYDLILHSKSIKVPKFLYIFLISTDEHHLHHSTNLKYFNKNFGNFFKIWDVIFGTYCPSLKKKYILGIKDLAYNNTNFFNQIIYSIRVYYSKLF